jgi:TolA-binding protein
LSYTALARGDSLAEKALLDASGYYHAQVLEKRSSDSYKKVVDLYWDYIRTYPDHEKASECHFAVAELLFGRGDYLSAAREYMAISRQYKESKYRLQAAWNAVVAAQSLLQEEKEKEKILHPETPAESPPAAGPPKPPEGKP